MRNDGKINLLKFNSTEIDAYLKKLKFVSY